MDSVLIARYRWFRAQGVGGWVGHDAETCLAYARAEQRAEAEGLVYIVEDSPEAYAGAPGTTSTTEGTAHNGQS